MTLSDSTTATLIEVVSHGYSHSDLSTLFLRIGCAGIGPGYESTSSRPQPNKVDRLRPVVDHLRQSDDEPNEITLVRHLIEVHHSGHVFTYSGEVVAPLEQLVRELEIEGYTVSGDGRLVATTPGPAALAPEISLLERELSDRGFDVAARHYREAVDSFVDGRLEASNGQLRSFLEDLLPSLCQQVTGSRPGDARGAAQNLRQHRDIDADEERLIKGLAGVSNERGAHAGLTDDDEALFRIHMTTATARYLLARLP